MVTPSTTGIACSSLRTTYAVRLIHSPFGPSRSQGDDGPRASSARRRDRALAAAQGRPRRARKEGASGGTMGSPTSFEPGVLQVVVAERLDEEAVELAREGPAERGVVEKAHEGVCGGHALDPRVEHLALGLARLLLRLV